MPNWMDVSIKIEDTTPNQIDLIINGKVYKYTTTNGFEAVTNLSFEESWLTAGSWIASQIEPLLINLMTELESEIGSTYYSVELDVATAVWTTQEAFIYDPNNEGIEDPNGIGPSTGYIEQTVTDNTSGPYVDNEAIVIDLSYTNNTGQAITNFAVQVNVLDGFVSTAAVTTAPPTTIADGATVTGQFTITYDIADDTGVQLSVLGEGEISGDLIPTETEMFEIVNSVTPPPTTSGVPDRTDFDGDVVSFSVASYFTAGNGGPLTFSASGLPAGTSIDSAGLITGTINEPSGGPFTVTITATEGTETVSDDFTWTINL